jgi:hypothetical protein
LAPETAARPTASRALPIWLLWLLTYAASAFVGSWLWRRVGIASLDLLFLDARARIAASAPLASELLLSMPLLVFLPTLVSGSATLGAAFAMACTVAAAGAVLRAAGRSLWWLALLVLHPAIFVAGLEYPAVAAELGAVVTAVAGMTFYIRHRRLDWLTCGGLALGALVLVDWRAWPFPLVVAAIMALWHRGEWREKATLVLVVIFPTLGLMTAWMAFNGMITGRPFAFLERPLLALSRMDAWTVPTEEGGLTRLGLAVLMGPLLLLAPAWAVSVSREDRRTAISLMLLALSPLVLGPLASAGEMSAPALIAGACGLAALLVTLTFMPRGRVAFAAAAALIATGVVAGHAVVFADRAAEPARLAARLAGGGDSGRLADLRACAEWLNARTTADDRVIFDDVQLFPLAGLLASNEAWIPSSSAEFWIARQQPVSWARFVVDVAPDGPLARQAIRVDRDELARDYVLVRSLGELRVFERRATTPPPMRIVFRSKS